MNKTLLSKTIVLYEGGLKGIKLARFGPMYCVAVSGSFLVSEWGICLLESEIILRLGAHLHCEAVIINIIIINRVGSWLGMSSHISPSLCVLQHAKHNSLTH